MTFLDEPDNVHVWHDALEFDTEGLPGWECENCGSDKMGECVHVNPYVPTHDLATNEDVRFDAIEGSEFLMCLMLCGWRIYMSEKTRAAIRQLQKGEPVLGYKEGGNSMLPYIKSMQPVDLYPVDVDKLDKRDIVLVRVGGNVYTHFVAAVKPKQVLIGNARGKLNGWTPKHQVFGIVVAIGGKPYRGRRTWEKVPVEARSK